MRRFLYDTITHQRNDRLARTVRQALKPLSGLYRLCLHVADRRRDRAHPHQLNLPVISVGNIIAGGTGKTVIVQAIAEQYLTWGYRPLILTRGYGGRTREGCRVASDGTGKLASPDLVGDEAVMLGRQLEHVPVVVGRDRIAAAKWAIETFDPELIILDDAFQYRRLARDLDIVAIPAPMPWGTGVLLPAGTLRELPAALARADLIVLTHADQASDLDVVREQVASHSAGLPLVETRHRPKRLRQISTGVSMPLRDLAGRRVLAVSALGRPEAFYRTLAELDAEVIPMSFPDHHRYGEDDIVLIQQLRSVKGADCVVMTEKDAVKLSESLDWYCLEVRLEVTAGREAWEGILARTVGRPLQSSG